MALLQVERLTVSFDQPRVIRGEREYAVRNLSFKLEEGQTLGLAGESGSGKTVTALSIIGLLPKKAIMDTASKILFQPTDDPPVDLSRQSPRQWEKLRGSQVGMIFQDPGRALNPVLTCGHQLEETLRLQFPGESRKAIRERAAGWMRRVELTDTDRVLSSSPHQLSGGQKQRVMLALAVCRNPRLLLADEPTTALDTTVQARVLDLVRQLQEEMGLSILYITHDLALLRDFADEILVLKEGQFVEQGPPGLLFHSPQKDYTRFMLSAWKTEEPPRLKPETRGTENPILEVSGLSSSYACRESWWRRPGVVPAVRDLSFSLFPGETVGIVGESGSGKSTLARNLLGLVPYQEGTIRMDGKSLEALDKKGWKWYRRQVQLLFQHPFSALNPALAVGEAIAEVAGIHSGKAQRREKARELMEKAGLDPGLYWRFPKELSGGQQQRVSLARALAVEPRVLVCDEAVSSLDVPVQVQVIKLLQALQMEKGISMLFISHDLRVIRRIADRVLVMEKGRVVEEAPPAELFERPRSEAAKKLLAAL